MLFNLSTFIYWKSHWETVPAKLSKLTASKLVLKPQSGQYSISILFDHATHITCVSSYIAPAGGTIEARFVLTVVHLTLAVASCVISRALAVMRVPCVNTVTTMITKIIRLKSCSTRWWKEEISSEWQEHSELTTTGLDLTWHHLYLFGELPPRKKLPGCHSSVQTSYPHSRR